MSRRGTGRTQWPLTRTDTNAGTDADARRPPHSCPETWKMLTKMKRFIPNTLCMFSRVQGGGRIRSHTGLTNLAVRVHLALEVPEPHRTVIRVGEQVRTWEEGKCLIFNDAFDHQVGTTAAGWAGARWRC